MSDSLNSHEKKALDQIIEKIELEGINPTDPVAYTPLVVQATMYVAATVAGSCATTDEDLIKKNEFLDKLKQASNFKDLKGLKDL